MAELTSKYTVTLRGRSFGRMSLKIVTQTRHVPIESGAGQAQTPSISIRVSTPRFSWRTQKEVPRAIIIVNCRAPILSPTWGSSCHFGTTWASERRSRCLASEGQRKGQENVTAT
eukprot:82124-Amorphochlora_amoeboformis.AAC.2